MNLRKYIVALLMLAIASMVNAQGIKFEEGTWEEIKAMARNEKKVIFMDAYTTWCGPCKWMAKNTFPDPIVGKYFNDNFINVKFDMEKGEGLAIAKTYEVRAYPTLLFIAGDGELVHKKVGALDATALLMEGKAAIDPEDRLLTWQNKYKNGERSPEFMSKYIAKLADAYLPADEVAKEFLSSVPEKQLLEKAYWDIFNDHGTLAMERECKFYAANQAEVKKLYGERAYEDKVRALFRRPMLVALVKEGEKSASFQTLKGQLASFKAKDEKRLIEELEIDAARAKKDYGTFASKALSYAKRYTDAEGQWMNSIAWAVYENAEDKKTLSTAANLSQLSLKKEPTNWAYMDTYASLQYKLGNKKEAATYAQKAIEAGIAAGEDVAETQELMKKIAKLPNK